MFLTEIIELKKKRLEIDKASRDFEELRQSAIAKRQSGENHRLRSQLQKNQINIIAEIKRASPSKGVINDRIDVAETARAYERGGAAAISVLTEEDRFKGSLEDLKTVRRAVDLPILRKDFIFDEFQIFEAAEAGADVILLIAAMLDDETLIKLLRLAEDDLGLDALVEIHTLEELERVKKTRARIIGVNNRDLHSFRVSLDTSRELIKHAPPGALMITESGISTKDEIIELRELGFSGFLIGETLMRSESPLKTLKSYTSIQNPKSEIDMTKVKICGITNLEDALIAAKFGADALGFNFYRKSPRYIAPETAREIIEKLPLETLKVGVFVNESLEKIAEIAETARLDALQLHGEESPAFARELKSKTGLEIIKAFRVSPEFQPEDVLRYETDAILLDAYNPKEHGGTGETFDWEIAKRVQEVFPKMYLAGGLSPENVVDAVLQVKPFAVDACSCLEAGKGKKDKTSLINFICNVRFLGGNLDQPQNLFYYLRLYRRRPKLYLLDKSLTHLCIFIIGYLCALEYENPEYLEIKRTFDGFDKYLGIYKGSFVHHYYGYARHFLEQSNDDEEKAFDLFYAAFEEFLLERDLSNE